MPNVKELLFFVLFALNLFMTTAANADFSGHWCWDKDSEASTFSIRINKNNNDIYKGSYSSVAYHGNKIDDNDNSFSFKTIKNIVRTEFKAGITGNKGLIEIKLINSDKLSWLVLKEPEGEIYVPNKAILHRCDNGY